VSFSWNLLDGQTRFGRGVCRDICTDGVFVSTENCPPLGSNVRLKIAFPESWKGARNLQLAGCGVVVRVTDVGGVEPGFAACLAGVLEFRGWTVVQSTASAKSQITSIELKLGI
jgi:hypothetical protein